MTVKIVVDVLLWALAAKTLYRPVNLLWPWTSNLESITSKSWDSPVKTSKTVSILIAETFLLLQAHLPNCYFQKSWSALWQETILPKETEPTPKADRNRPLRLDPPHIRYFPDINFISFDDSMMPLQDTIALLNYPQRLPQVGDTLSAPEVWLCKPQEALLLTWQPFQGCQSKQPPRYLCIDLDQSRL